MEGIVLWLVLVVSILNLALLLVNLSLLRHGYSQSQQVKVLVLGPGGELLGQQRATQRTATVGADGTLRFADGEGFAERLCLPGLAAGQLADVYVVARA